MINDRAFRYFGFDIDKAKEYTGGINELEVVLNNFAKCYEKNKRDIEADYEMEMYAEYATHVNSLKNNLRTIGLKNMYDVADKCEEMGRKYSKKKPNAREKAEFDKTNGILLQKYKEVVGFINEQIDTTATASPEGTIYNNSELVELIDDFINSCEDFDDNKAKSCIRKIYKYKADIVVRNHIDLAKTYIDEFEYDEAISEAKEARKKIKA